jgi:hypothetical protein
MRMRTTQKFVQRTIWSIPTGLLRGGAFALVLLCTSTAWSDQEKTFVFKRSLLSPPPERTTSVEQQRALNYRHRLQNEIRRLETRRDNSNPRAANRLGRARGELTRIRRATRR